MLAPLVLVSLALHTVWGSGNLYEALVIAPPWLRSWRSGRAPNVRIDPRIYYLLPALFGPASAVAAAGLGFATSFAARWLLALAAAASLTGVGLTIYVVVAINLELFFHDPPPPPARGLALMRRWASLNVIRLLMVAVVLIATVRASQGR